MIPSRRETEVAAGSAGLLLILVAWCVAMIFLLAVGAVAVGILAAWSTLHVLGVVDRPAPWAEWATAAEAAIQDAKDG